MLDPKALHHVGSKLAMCVALASAACASDAGPGAGGGDPMLTGGDGSQPGVGTTGGVSASGDVPGTEPGSNQTPVPTAGANPGTQPATPSTDTAPGGPTDTPAVVNQNPTVAPTTVADRDGDTVDCTTLQRPPTPLRRLTRFEYDNTVRDLLQTELRPSAAFPPDEVADGYSNNGRVLTVSSLHAEKYVAAAEALAADALARLDTLLPCEPTPGQEEVCARQFAEQFGRLAFRRPLQAEDVDALLEAYAAGSEAGFEHGIEVMIRAILQSPHFLYRVEFTGGTTLDAGMVRLDGFETASRLSYLLWSSAPDPELLDAAEAGQLQTPEQVEARARAMLQDPRAKEAAAEFFRQWLGLTRLEAVTKSTELFPLWSEELRQAMISESTAFVEHVLWDNDAKLASLLKLPAGLPQGPLATLYGVPESSEIATFAPEQRVGVLTLPGFMAVQSHPDQTSPVLRGKFVRSKLLCTPPPPPPPDANVSPPPPGEGGTARERFERHASDAECNACHQLMDPLGFAFENYDALGSYRTTDAGQELDVSGSMVASVDMDGPFEGVAGLAEKLSGSNQVRDCIATQWFKYAQGRSDEAGDACSVLPLQTAFEGSEANLLELMVSVTQTEAFLYRRAETSEEAAR